MIPLSQVVDVSTRGAGPWLETTAWVLLGIILMSTLLLLAMMRYQVYTPEQRRHLSSIRAGEINADPPRIIVERGYQRNEIENAIQSAWSNRPSQGHTRSLSEAVRNARADIAKAFPTLPPLVRNGVIEGFSIVMLAIIVYFPIEMVLRPRTLYRDLGTWNTDHILQILTHPAGLEGLLPIVLGENIASVILLAGWLIWEAWVFIGFALLISSFLLYNVHQQGYSVPRWFRWSYGVLLVIGLIILMSRSLWLFFEAFRGGTLVETILVLFGIAGVIVVICIAILVRLNTDSWADIQDAVSTILRSTALRGVIVSRGLPYATVFLSAIILLSWIPTPVEFSFRPFGIPLPTRAGLHYLLIVATVSVGAGLLVRMVGWIWSHAKYRAIDRAEIRDTRMQEVHLRPYIIEDHDGERIHVCKVDGYTLANRSVDELSDDVFVAVEELLTNSSDRNCTFSHYYADRVDTGIVDEDSVKKILRGEIKSDIRSSISRSSSQPPRINAELLHDKLNRKYPSKAYLNVLADLHRRGEVYKHNDNYILYG